MDTAQKTRYGKIGNQFDISRASEDDTFTIALATKNRVRKTAAFRLVYEEFRGGTIGVVRWIVLGLCVSALAVLAAAEWPRLQSHLGFGRYGAFVSRKARRRRRRRSHLVLVETEDLSDFDEDREAFAESVARDLERLPTIDDRD
jgi:hypothetical protein